MPSTGEVDSVFDDYRNTLTSCGSWPLTVCIPSTGEVESAFYHHWVLCSLCQINTFRQSLIKVSECFALCVASATGAAAFLLTVYVYMLC